MNEDTFLRLGIFLTVLAFLIIAEFLLPRRALSRPRLTRWPAQFGLSLLNTALLMGMSVALPLLAVGAAIDAANIGWGIFNGLNWPRGIEILLVILILDLMIWTQHWMMHQLPVLWRLHRVHHIDEDLDATSGLRFHPIEIAISMLLKIGAVYLLGPAAIAVVIYEVSLNAMAMFNHANLAIPKKIDRWLRLVIVTPDMHRVHHSIDRAEHDRNYGNLLSIWDRAFGTYLAQPRLGHQSMKLGLLYERQRPNRLDWLIAFPFFKR